MALMVRRTELCNGSSGVMILSRDGGRYSYYNVILVRKRKNFKLLSEHGNAQREQRILHTCNFWKGVRFSFSFTGGACIDRRLQGNGDAILF